MTTTNTTVTIAGQERPLERMSARKASSVLAILRALSNATDGIRKHVTAFERTYGEENYLELDRVQARLRYPAQPILTPEGTVVREPEFLAGTVQGDEGDADVEAVRNPRAGELVMAPSPVDSMTDEDWTASGGKLRLPASPTNGERVAALLDEALEVAEEHVYRLLALLLMPNSEVAEHRKAGDLTETLGERADTLLDEAFGDELLELAVAAGELVDAQFISKARDLGDRLGNVTRLFGMTPRSSKAPATEEPRQEEETPPTPEPESSPTSADGPSSSRPRSSTASPAPTTEEGSTPSSTSPGTSATPSSTGSSATPEQPRSEAPAAA